MTQATLKRAAASVTVEFTPMANAYRYAKEMVMRRGFGGEIDWQARICVDTVSESYFLREAAWVVLSAGMRESIVRKVFPSISLAFHEWASAQSIVNNRQACVSGALNVFNHEKKINAIADIAASVYDSGFEQVMTSIRRMGVKYLQTFPFIGPITSFHLAKNLGLDVVKPDRHLIRVAEATGYSTPDEMCRDIAHIVGDTVPVIDLVIWRFATIEPRYVSVFAAGCCHAQPLRDDVQPQSLPPCGQ